MRGQSFHRARMQPSPKPWYERDGGIRLAHDRTLVTNVYPGLKYSIDDEAGRIYIEGAVRLLAECGVPTDIQVRVEFPDDYPKGEPRAYDAANRFPHTADRHFYPDGRCCLWLPPESRWNQSDHEGLCRFLEEVAVFFDRQLVYDAEGKGTWPGEQRGHGYNGYAEFVQELLGGDQQLLILLAPIFANVSGIGRNSQCPCGSGLKYKKCHMSTVEEISRKVGFVTIRVVFREWLQKASIVEKVKA